MGSIMSDSDKKEGLTLGGLFTLGYAIWLLYEILSMLFGPTGRKCIVWCLKWIAYFFLFAIVMGILGAVIQMTPSIIRPLLILPGGALCYYSYVFYRKKKKAKEDAEVYQYLVENFFPDVARKDANRFLTEYVFDHQKRAIVMAALDANNMVEKFADKWKDADRLMYVDSCLQQETICHLTRLTSQQEKSKHWNSIHPGIPLPGYYDQKQARQKKPMTDEQYERHQLRIRERQKVLDAEYAVKAVEIAKKGAEAKAKYKRGELK